MKAPIYIMDFDDFAGDNNILPRLRELKEILPNLKVNLFAIPTRTPEKLLAEVWMEDWLRAIPHGLTHDSNYEFAGFSPVKAKEMLDKIPLREFYDPGFKAPGWQISLGTMEALKEMGHWVAVQYADDTMNGNTDGPYQPAVIPGLKYYAINQLKPGYMAIHGHCQEVCNNSLEDLWPALIKLPKDSKFIFIDDYVRENFSNR